MSNPKINEITSVAVWGLSPLGLSVIQSAKSKGV